MMGSDMRSRGESERTYILELLLQELHHVLLNDQVGFIEILNDDVMVLAVEMDDDGLDGGFALNKHAWEIG